MYEKLPQELKERGNFCLWKYEERDGRMTKVPYQANGLHADSTNKDTFTDYSTAVKHSSEYDGLGIGVFGDICAIDIYHCVENGVLSDMAKDIIAQMDTYTEYSPSGTGVRILFKALLPAYDKDRYYINNRKIGLEVYVAGYTSRFVTVTGNAIRGIGIEERSEPLAEVLEKNMRKAEKPVSRVTVPGSYLSDASVLQKALVSKQGEKLKALWDGIVPDGKSHSEADAALCAILAFWCGGDTEQMDRLFRRSALMRDKWEREDYRKATRPDWQRLLGLINEEKIGIIIVKDMSRLGRDYLQVGMYTEMLFPAHDIRFIAINNGVDSINGTENDMTPFINIFNEFYAKDTSRKIKAVFKAKGNSGKPLCTNPPYGYLKDPEDKNHWIVDKEAAEVIREIFRLCIAGYGPSQIASILEERQIEIPICHAKRLGITLPARSDGHSPYGWDDTTITRIFTRQEYLGHTVNFKTRTKSFRDRKKLENDPSEWVVFENTHEAIIDQESFDIVQRIREGRRRVTPMGEMPVLSGMLFCADCGSKLYQVRHRGWSHEQEIFVCAKYRKHKGMCTPHQIHNVQVEEILLRELQRITAYAREHEDEFVQLVTRHSEKELNRQLRDSNRELAQAEDRIGKLDGIIQRLYEDNVEGKISDERFSRMSASYEAEQKQLESRKTELTEFITASKEQRLNVDSFLGMVRKYTDNTELSAEIIRSFVEKIEVLKPEKVPGTRTKKQTIIIHWNFIGAVDIPEEQEKTA